MAILSYIFEHTLPVLFGGLLIVPVYHLLAWLLDEHGIRSFPGPKLAALSDAWLGYWAAQGCRSVHVHEMHREYGSPSDRVLIVVISHYIDREIRAHCAQPCINQRPRRPPDSICSRKWDHQSKPVDQLNLSIAHRH